MSPFFLSYLSQFRALCVMAIFSLFLAGCSGGGSGSSGGPTGGGGGGTNNVPIPTVISLEVSPATFSLPRGTSVSLNATALLSDGNRVNVTSLAVWTSGDANLATVSQGVATALKDSGQVQIQAAFQGQTSSATITLSSAILQRVSVSPSPLALPLGAQEQLVVTGTFSDGQSRDVTNDVTWTSDNSSLVSVSTSLPKRGLVTGAAVGTTNVRGTISGFSLVVEVRTTSASLTRIEVTPAQDTLPRGITRQLRATGYYTDSSQRDVTEQASWISNLPTGVAVSDLAGSKGLILALEQGTVQISASLPGLSSFAEITVTPAELVSLAVTPANPSLPEGITQGLTATGTFTDQTQRDLTRQVTWTSLDTNVASVSNSDGTQGQVLGRNQGATSVQAGLFGITGTTNLTVVQAILAGLEIAPVNPSVSLSRRTQPFILTGVFSNGQRTDVTVSATWESQNSAVATVGSRTGVAALRQVGKSTITARLNGFSASSDLNVVRVAGLDWVKRQELLRVANSTFGDGHYVLAVEQGLMVSEDGDQWEPVSLPEFPAPYFYNHQFYVAASDGKFYSSPNAHDWQPVGTVPERGNLAFGNGTFVLAAGQGRVYTSADGQSWVLQNSGVSRNSFQIAFGGGHFVVVNDDGSVISSDDAVHWQTTALGATPFAVGICYGNGQFVVVGDDAYTSPDGVNWTRRVIANPAFLTGVTFGNGVYVAGGNDNRLYRSLDGVNWTASTAGQSDDNFGHPVFGDLGFVAAGTRHLAGSLDGQTWTPRGLEGSLGVQGLAYGGGRYVIPLATSGANLFILTSTDQINWTSIPVTQQLDQAVYDGGKWVAVGDNVCATSTDGLNWTFKVASALRFSRYKALVYGGGHYVAIASGGREIKTSNDGVNWTAATNPSALGTLSGLTYGQGFFLASLDNNRQLKSVNGTTWTLINNGVNVGELTFGNGKFVSGSGRGAGLYSTDGQNWTPFTVDFKDGINYLCYANGLFVAASSYGSLAVSQDAVTWTRVDSHTLNFVLGLAGGDGSFVYLGQNGTILSSP